MKWRFLFFSVFLTLQTEGLYGSSMRILTLTSWILTHIYCYRTEKEFLLSVFTQCAFRTRWTQKSGRWCHICLAALVAEGWHWKDSKHSLHPEDVYQHFHSWNWSCVALPYWYLITFSNQISFKKDKKQLNKQKKRWELHQPHHFSGIPHMDKQGCLYPRHKSIPLPLKPLEYPQEHIPNFLILETLMEPSPSRQINPKQQEILF